MYELAILSLLMRQPAHGYLISKVLSNIIGPMAKPSNGRIYPLLARLEESGLITARDEELDGRPARIYRITPKGRERFREMMLDTDSYPKEYQELFALKVTVFPLIQPEERVRLIAHYEQYALAHIAHLKAGLSEVGSGGIPEEGAPLRLVLLHRLDQWELELAWAKSLRALYPTPRTRTPK